MKFEIAIIGLPRISQFSKAFRLVLILRKVKVIQNYMLTLNFVKERNHKHLKNTFFYKAK